MQTPRIDTVRLSDDGSALVIIDQTLLPGELKYLSLTKTEDITGLEPVTLRTSSECSSQLS